MLVTFGKRCVFLCAVASSVGVACGDSEDGEALTACTAEQEGDESCEANQRVRCTAQDDGFVLEGIESCEGETPICNVAFDVSACIALGEPFQACAIDSDCGVTLDCVDFSAETAFASTRASYCVQPCTSDEECASDEVCNALLGPTSATQNIGGCIATGATRHEPCWLSGTDCADGLICSPNLGVDVFTCRQPCDVSELFTQGSCATGEECLLTQLQEPQLNGSDPVTCTAAGEVDNCDSARNGRCLPVTSTVSWCFVAQPVCGLAAQVASDLSTATFGTICESPGATQLCRPFADPAVTAQVECEATSFLIPVTDAIGGTISCDTTLANADQNCGPHLGGSCFSVSGGADTCAVPIGLCFAFCEDQGSDGVIDTSLTCPASQTCQVPIDATNEPLFLDTIFQEQSPGVTCTADADCDEASGFACNGAFCARTCAIGTDCDEAAGFACLGASASGAGACLRPRNICR